MKYSQSLVKTCKDASNQEDSKNARYFIRTGMVDKHMAGVYAFMPLGLRVLRKIENIIREEMNAVGGQEILMNVLQPKSLWDETGRFDKMKEIFYQLVNKKGQILGLGPTHEEQVVDIARKYISSYKELPLSLYQIQVKFRNEARAKSGLLRGREFIMKDMYSFHQNTESFTDYYENVKLAYLKLFNRMGLPVKITKASGGIFSEFSDEFQLLDDIGEDKIFYCNSCDYAVNNEVAEVKAGDNCPNCNGEILVSQGIEAGNIFPLGDKFSRDMKFKLLNQSGQEFFPVMGCYGIGLGRLMGIVVEKYFNEGDKKMIWPKELSPFDIYLVSLSENEMADDIYKMMRESKIDIFFDDREVSAGEKLMDADLIGCRYRVIVSQKSIDAGGVEWVDILENKKKIFSAEKLLKQISLEI